MLTDIHRGLEYAGKYSRKSVFTEHCWCDLENRLGYFISDVVWLFDNNCIFKLILVKLRSDLNDVHPEIISYICYKFQIYICCRYTIIQWREIDVFQ